MNCKIFNLAILATASLAFVVSNVGCARFLARDVGILESVGTNDESLEMLFGIGRLAERNNKTQKAIEAYETILKSHPDHVATLHRMGVIDAKRGMTDSSITWLEKAAQFGNPSAKLLGDLGYAHYLAGDLETAQQFLNQGIDQNPDDSRMLNNLAIVNGAMQRYDEAMNLFRRTGTEAEALASIAFVQSQSGNLGEAKRNYMNSLSLDSTLEVAANGLIELDRSGKQVSIQRKQGVPLALPSKVQLASYHEPIDTPSEANQSKGEDSPSLEEPESKGILQPILSAGGATPVLNAIQLPGKTSEQDVRSVKARLRGPREATVDIASSFSVIVENETAQLARNVKVELSLDSQMEIANVSREAWLDENTNSVSWSFAELKSGENSTIEFEAIGVEAGTLTHQLSISVDGQPVGELSLTTVVKD